MGEFVNLVLDEYVMLLGGGAVIVALGLFERYILKKAVSLRLYTVLLVILLFYASFRAWDTEHSKVASLQNLSQKASDELLRLTSEIKEKDRAIQEKESTIETLRNAFDVRPILIPSQPPPERIVGFLQFDSIKPLPQNATIEEGRKIALNVYVANKGSAPVSDVHVFRRAFIASPNASDLWEQFHENLVEAKNGIKNQKLKGATVGVERMIWGQFSLSLCPRATPMDC